MHVEQKRRLVHRRRQRHPTQQPLRPPPRCTLICSWRQVRRSFFVVRVSRLWLTEDSVSREDVIAKPSSFANRRTNHDLPSTTHANHRGPPRRRHLIPPKVNDRRWPKYRSSSVDRIARSFQTFSGFQQTFEGECGIEAVWNLILSRSLRSPGIQVCL